MASADTRWRLRQWAFATLAAIAPFVAVSYDADPSPFAAVFLALAVLVLGFGVVGRPQERRCGLLLTTLILGTLFWAIMAKPFLSARKASPAIHCVSNVRQQTLGMMMYAADYDDHFPQSDTWHTTCKSYVKFKFHCPSATSPWSYAMNTAFSGKVPATEPTNEVLLFEANAALPNASGGREWLVFRHKGHANFGMTDGSAHPRREEEAAKLRWK